MPDAEETALVVLVPEVEGIVARLRSQFDRSAGRGMPAHITLLYPFVHPDEVSGALCDALRELFAGLASFRFLLEAVCGFPGVVYLLPDPLAPFDALTRAIADRFPAYPPYGGAFANPLPHLTIAQAPPALSLADVVEDFLASARASLPVPCAADDIALAVKRDGRWGIGPRFPLG